jgi:hypothetical protein
MLFTRNIAVLASVLLLSGCGAAWLDPRINQAPMGATAKRQARDYFNLPNHKAFAFSPDKGTNRHTWGSASAEAAARTAMEQCEELTRTRCVLFAVDNEIIWGPSGNEMVAGTQGAIMASAYLLGTFDIRGNRRTLFQVVNPTGANVRFLAAFFNESGTPLSCHSGTLPANGLVEIDVRKVGVRAPLGVVKVVALADSGARPGPSLTGSSRITIAGQPVTETWLHPMQTSLPSDELSTVGRLCGRQPV